MANVKRITKAGIGIHHEGQLNGLAHSGSVLGHFIEADKSHVREPQRHVADSSTREIKRFKSCIFDNSSTQGVEDAGHQHGVACHDPSPKGVTPLGICNRHVLVL